MNKNALPDKTARERITAEFDKNFFVEAGAGSGKTHSMVERMAALIKSGHAKIENISAVTFTRKAAAQLREGFQITLERAFHDKHTSAKDKDNIRTALSNFERSSISTIHSFCARLLRERPVEAGIDPGFEEIEENEDAVFAKQVWSEFIERQGFENNKTIGWMRDNGISPESLEDVYIKLARYRDVDVVTEDVPKPDLSEGKNKVKQFIDSMKTKLPSNEPEKGWDELQKMIRKSLKLISLGYLEEDRLFITLLHVLMKKPDVTHNRWLSGQTEAEDCAKKMCSFQEDTVSHLLQEWGEYLHKPLILFAQQGVKYYENWRKERSILNFQDLLMSAAALLRENPEVRDYFKKIITHLLVDEFQDTDPIQAEVVLLLTSNDNSEKNWRKVFPKEGSLFLVGDPKQSIYRFRRADIDMYNYVKEIFRKGAGEVLELTSNFRSLDHIGDMTDTVFKDIFPVSDTRYQAKFVPLMTTREKGALCEHGILENIIEKITGSKAQTIAEIDAGRIASWIYHCINGGLKLDRAKDEKEFGLTQTPEPGDFMIITKLKKRLQIYARALEDMGIPYQVSGGEGFGESVELYEIYKVLKAVADPRNSVALVAALRGRFFGVSDNDLYKFVKSGGRFSYFTKPETGPRIISDAFSRLREYNEIVRQNSPVTAVEMILEKLAAIPFAVSQEAGSSRTGNVLKAVELLREHRADQTGTFTELVDYLYTLLDTKDIEEMWLFPRTAKAVRVMNLHKAKGLEAPVVILADPLGISKEYAPELHVTRTADKPAGYFTVTSPTGHYGTQLLAVPQNWEAQASEEKIYEDAEKKRLDYVAVTRAKNILVVSTYREGRKKKAWEFLSDYLEGAPKLEVPEAPAKKKREIFDIEKSEWDREKSGMHEDIHSICTQSYNAESVTASIDKSGVFEESAGSGPTWGTIVHRALEACANGKRDRLETLGQKWLADEKLPPEQLPRLTELADKVMKSELWKRLLEAKEKYYEVPFSIMKEGTVLSGVIDLAFKEEDGWVLVDYKTDDFEKDPKRKEVYEKQLDMYAESWQKATGEKVKEKLLYAAI